VIWLSTLWYLLTRGRLGAADETLVDMAGLYWHFVDVVWILLYTVVYLL
jgi:heme/copper-type cytochrome/quinol oxidase subunit 3